MDFCFSCDIVGNLLNECKGKEEKIKLPVIKTPCDGPTKLCITLLSKNQGSHSLQHKVCSRSLSFIYRVGTIVGLPTRDEMKVRGRKVVSEKGNRKCRSRDWDAMQRIRHRVPEVRRKR